MMRHGKALGLLALSWFALGCQINFASGQGLAGSGPALTNPAAGTAVGSPAGTFPANLPPPVETIATPRAAPGGNAAANAVPAPIAGTDRVIEVRIEGASNVGTLPKMSTRAGTLYDPKTIEDDVRALDRTRKFVSIKPRYQTLQDGLLVTFQVVERPLLRYVKFIGMQKIGESTLKKQAELKVGDALDPHRVEEARRTLENYYHEKGFVEAYVSVVEGNKVGDKGAVFVINEGNRQKVWWTQYVGNTIATDARLNTQIQSKPGILWIGGHVDRNKIDDDIKTLTEYYRSLGFFQARISRELDVSPSGWLTLTFIIHEGPRYKVRNFSVIGNEKFNQAELLSKLQEQSGEYFDQAKLNADINAIRDLYGGQGHIFCDIDAETRFLETPGELDIVFSIKEGAVYRVGQILVDIRGSSGESSHSRERTVLNRISLRPGDIVDTRLIRADEIRLKRSGLFNNDPTKGAPPQIVVTPPEGLDEEARELARKNTSTNRNGKSRFQSPDVPTVTVIIRGTAVDAVPGTPPATVNPPAQPELRLPYHNLPLEAVPYPVTPNDAAPIPAAPSTATPSPAASHPTSRPTFWRANYTPAESTPRPSAMTPLAPSAALHPDRPRINRDFTVPDTALQRTVTPPTQTVVRFQSPDNTRWAANSTTPASTNSGIPPASPSTAYVPSNAYIPSSTVGVDRWSTPATPNANYVASGSMPYQQSATGFTPSGIMPDAYPQAGSTTGYAAQPAFYTAATNTTGQYPVQPTQYLADPATESFVGQPSGGNLTVPGYAPGTAVAPSGIAPTDPSASPWSPAINANGQPLVGGIGQPNGVPGQGAGILPQPSEPINPQQPWQVVPEGGFVDLTGIVTETQTGRLMFGVGVNSNAGVIGNIVLDEQNFDIWRPATSWNDFVSGRAWRGAGQRFRLEAAPGSQVSRYTISFQEPYLWDSPVALSMSGFYFQRGYRDWYEERVGGRFGFAYQIPYRPDLSIGTKFRIENINISNPRVTTVPELNEVVGHNDLYGFGINLAHDTRDSPFLPTEGWFAQYEVEYVTGSFDYPRATVEMRKYFTLTQRADGSGRQVLAIGGDFGISGNDTPIYDNFFIGGFSTLRGFRFRGASPRVNDVIVGGPLQLVGTVEYMVPITADDSLRAVAFCDFGTVEQDYTINSQNFRVALGGGLRISVPALGPAPIALDFATVVNDAAGDQTQVFTFFVGLGR
ncbi:MAG: BamA/TamA family outer membrane protein [Pirellulales bacterium]|nr:BamA/TamA family outer membrane protein [Pirellulales bacterium]